MTPGGHVVLLQPDACLPSWDNGSVQKGADQVVRYIAGERPATMAQILSKCRLFQLANGQSTLFRSIQA
jgi:hypothetical protein